MPPTIVSLALDPSILTSRERQVLIGLAQGLHNREIADALVPAISVKTVDTHRSHALKKLGLRNNSDVTRYAIRHGLIDVDGAVLVPEPAADGAVEPVAPIAQPRAAVAQVETRS